MTTRRVTAGMAGMAGTTAAAGMKGVTGASAAANGAGMTVASGGNELFGMVLPTYDLPQRVSQLRVLRSEWTKLRSLRSTVWSLLIAAGLIIGGGVLASSVTASNWPPPNAADRAAFDPTAVSLTGVYLAQVAVGVLGVLLISGEYGTGMIRSTLAAVPRRLPVLWGKAIVFVLPFATGFLPADWSDRIGKYLPYSAGTAITNVSPDSNSLAPWTGFGVFCLYAAVALGLAAWQLRRRDA
jgi:hypothetical protein